MDPYLFFPTDMLTAEGVKWLERLNNARIERDFRNLPHFDAYAVFRVWTNEQGTGVGIAYAASDNSQIRDSYLVQGLKMALARNSAGLDAARRREEEWTQFCKDRSKTP